MADPSSSEPEWDFQRTYYEVLSAVYERCGPDMQQPALIAEVGAALDLHYEKLFQSLGYLVGRGYIEVVDPAVRVCITEAGIDYIEKEARRRRSIRE